ncbi:MAG: hypothetical protein AB2L12_11280 [Smithellaceae bacterium]
MNYAEFRGNNYELGYQAGQWWGKFFQDCLPDEKSPVRKFLGKKQCSYINFLTDSWSPKFFLLFKKVKKCFPDIMEEISGMVYGVKSTGLHSTLEHMFGLCLGETGARGYQCSSTIMETKNGFIIGHNEECDKVYPMLPAKVTLRQGKSEKKFISVSYPFQLFCSGTGMNSKMAFQGNSIGCYGKLRMLEKTWPGRIPKAVLTRKMAELDNIGDIEALYREYPTTLPSHHYIIFRDKAYSLDIAPGFSTTGNVKENIIRILPVKDLQFQTNHFLPANTNQKYFNDREWHWSDRNRDSKERFNYLQKHIKHAAFVPEVKEVLLRMAQSRKYRSITSATTFLELTDKKTSNESHLYFGKEHQIKMTLAAKP